MGLGIFKAIEAGLNLWDSYSQHSSGQKSAKVDLEAIEKQLDLLAEQEESVQNIYGRRKDLITDVYGNRYNFLREGYSSSLDRAREEADRATAQTGLAYSGSVAVERNSILDDMNRGLREQRSGLLENLGQNLMSLEEWKGSELGRIKGERISLEAQEKKAKQQKDEKFLGIF